MPRRFAGMNVLPMAASPRRKRGARRRPDQTRQRHEVDGFGRWRGYSVGSILGRGESGGSEAAGAHAGDGGGRTHGPTGSPPATPRPTDCRPWVRQQWTAGGLGAAGHRADHTGAEQQPSRHAPRRAQAAEVSATLDCGAHDCLDWALSTTGRAVRELVDDVCGFLSSRLCCHHVEEGFEMTSSLQL
jgi:hypothetical protein